MADPRPEPQPVGSTPGRRERVQPSVVAEAERQVRQDAADFMTHNTDGSARRMCRVGFQELTRVLAHYDQLKRAREALPSEGEELIKEIREALRPLARKEIPRHPQGNAGAYSILHSEIRAAQEALARADQHIGREVG